MREKERERGCGWRDEQNVRASKRMRICITEQGKCVNRHMKRETEEKGERQRETATEGQRDRDKGRGT